MVTWVKADSSLTYFNGIRKSVVAGAREIGIFKERYPVAGCYWSVRSRPLDSKGAATDGWGHGQPCSTMKEAIALGEKMANKKIDRPAGVC